MPERNLDRWFRAFFGSARDAFVVLDSSGSVLAANPRSGSLLGREPEELIGRSLEAVHAAIGPLELTLSPIEGDEALWLARMCPSASATSIAGAEFLSVLSHELRTPLQAILGWAQFLGSAPRDAETTQKTLGAIVRNVHWQSQVVEDLIEMSQIRSGALRLEMRVIPIAAAIESALVRVADAAEAKGVRLVREFEDASDEVLADPEALARATRRLLLDAIRFTAEGRAVGIGMKRIGPSIRVTITDGGGDDDPASSHASGWFRRSGSAFTHDFTAFGVGLASVQRIVEMHGGSVGAESARAERGAQFYLEIAFRPRAQP